MNRGLLFASALCLVASPALAQDEVDAPVSPPPPSAPAAAMPEAKFGVVFNLQNIFQNPGLLSGFNGGVGVQYGLSPTLTLRGVVALSHSSNPAVVTETTTTVNDMTTTRRTLSTPSPTSTFGMTVGADVLGNLVQGPLSPYLGGGLWFGLNSQATVYRDDVSVTDQVTAVNNTSLSLGVGARGILGVGWRVHPHFLLFAEYALNLTIVNHTSTRNSQEVTAMNASASSRSTSDSTRAMDFNTALSQGASLGLVALF